MSLDWHYGGQHDQSSASNTEAGGGDTPASEDAVVGVTSPDSSEGDWQPHQDLLYDTEESATTVARPHVNQSELLCRTGCGFYGYPAWQGHCSKCYKELQNRSSLASAVEARRTTSIASGSTRIARPVFDPTNIKNKVTRSVSDVSYLPGKASMLINRKIDKLDEKRRQQINKHKNNNIVKSIFRKSAIRDDIHRIKDPKQLTSASPAQEFEELLKTISKEGGGAVRKQVGSCVDKLKKTVHTQSVEETADQLQELYNSIYNMVTSHPAFGGLSSEKVSRICSLTESYVFSKLHAQLNACVNARCEEQDLAIQNRIRCLQWISPDMLECKLDEADESMTAALDSIIGELIEIDGKVVPSEKLSVLVSCCHQILQALSSCCKSSAASADDFLPALIYSVLRANPPMLHSNMTYITNFAPHSQLQSGEAGYYFTNLCCAVAFIEKVCGASLGLTEMEFERHMKGSVLPRQPKPPASVTAISNTLQRYCRAQTALEELIASYENSIRDIEQMEETVEEQVLECLDKCPLKLKPYYTVANIRELLQSGTPLLPDLPPVGTAQMLLPSSLGLPSTAAPPTTTALPECDEAYNLYYSLDDFTTTQSGQLSGGGALSLLDEPVPDDSILPVMADHVPTPPTSLAVSSVNSPIVTPPSSQPSRSSSQYTGFRVQSNAIPSIPCEMGPTSLTDSSRDAFGSPDQQESSLPPPLVPTPLLKVDTSPASPEGSRTPVTAQTTLDSSSSFDLADGCSPAAPLQTAGSSSNKSLVSSSGVRQGLQMTSTAPTPERKDTLEKVVDVLSDIADSIDQLL